MSRHAPVEAPDICHSARPAFHGYTWTRPILLITSITEFTLQVDAKYLAELALQQVKVHAIVLLDVHGNIVGWLGGAEQVLGYPAEEIVGQHISKLFIAEDRERALDQLELETARKSAESEDDRWQLRKDGAKIWASGAVAPLHDSEGRLAGYAKVLRNRTDNKAHLEALEAQLRASDDRDQRKNHFIATLAHELANPLSTFSNVGSILATNPDPTYQTLSLAVRTQVDAMNAMIGDLIEVTKAATGKLHLQPEPIVLQDVIYSAIETCKPAVQRHGHALDRLLPSAPIMLHADPRRLRQVFVNLINNAIKYTPDGGQIWVKATVDGEDAVIKVHDTGVGISPELMPHIFDLFVQAESKTVDQEGLGIGLSLVKDIIALHAGTVQVLSDGVGKGSIFVVRLPASEPRSSRPSPEAPSM